VPANVNRLVVVDARLTANWTTAKSHVEPVNLVAVRAGRERQRRDADDPLGLDEHTGLLFDLPQRARRGLLAIE